LQTRSGKRTASAAVKIAVDMVQDRMITEREALMRIDAKNMDYFLHPMVDPRAGMFVYFCDYFHDDELCQ
jgi:pyruvate,orthophosphate dikinase